MDREQLFRIAEQNQLAAVQLLSDSGIVEVWESIGATVNMVGSARSGLMMKNLDVDFHVYTDDPMLGKSFSAMMEFGKNPSVKEIQYRNLLDTEEECVEWHVRYQQPTGVLWKMDIIHIRKGSTYDGVIERSTDGVISRLTPEIREAILRIKYDMRDEVKTMGIEIYYAVIAQGIRNYPEFAEWKRMNPDLNLLGWLP